VRPSAKAPGPVRHFDGTRQLHRQPGPAQDAEEGPAFLLHPPPPGAGTEIGPHPSSCRGRHGLPFRTALSPIGQALPARATRTDARGPVDGGSFFSMSAGTPCSSSRPCTTATGKWTWP